VEETGKGRAITTVDLVRTSKKGARRRGKRTCEAILKSGKFF